MPLNLKIDVINDAYSQLRISGLTIQPTPEDVQVALNRLETFMHEMAATDLIVGYRFEELPDPNSETGVAPSHFQMMATNLALRLVPDFGKEPSAYLVTQARQSLENSNNIVAANLVQHVRYPNRQPRGSGNSIRYGRYFRYYREDPIPPDNSKVVRLGDVNDYSQEFSVYLVDAEVIDSFELVADVGLNILSSSNTDTEVLYRVQVETGNNVPAWRQVKISVTTDAGRVHTVFVNFNLRTDITVGGKV